MSNGPPCAQTKCPRRTDSLRYHDENTKLEDLTHPEDIEHFRKHEQMEAEQERAEQLTRQSIVEDNIPAKFRRD